MKTIKKFVDVYKVNETNIYDLISVKKYIPYEEKVRIARDVVDFSADYERGFIKIENLKKYFAFIFAVIEAHTDLRFADAWEDKMQEYDLLCENDLVDTIIGTFEKDYNASSHVLDMVCDDMLAENSFEASVAKLTQSAAENLDVLIGTLADKLEDTDIEKIIPSNLDLNKLQSFMSKFR